MDKTILITGATGFIGKRLVKYLANLGAFVKIITKNKEKAKKIFKDQFTVQIFEWNECDNPFTLSEILSETNAVINLAGQNIAGKRWNAGFKQRIYASRINSTRLLAESIKVCKKKPECLLTASGVGYYGNTGDNVVDENSPPGKDFLATLCRDWEAEAMKAVEYEVRVIAFRTGIVLDNTEGALKEMSKTLKYRFASYPGSGKQWISWIHIEDLISLFTFGLDNKNLFGSFNACSPAPVTYNEFATTLAKVNDRKIVLPVPGFILKSVIGEFANTLLQGQRAYPAKAIESGFTFLFGDLKSALENLYGRARVI